MRITVSLPYYRLHYREGRGRGRQGELYLEAFLSRVAEPHEICLLATPPPGLSEEPRSRPLNPWAEPGRLLRHYLSVSAPLQDAALPAPRGRWMLRRMLQEFNRLIAGALAGPPEAPEVDRRALRASLARRLCSDTVWKLSSPDTVLLSSRLLWADLTVEGGPGSSVSVYVAGRRYRVLEHLLNTNREAYRLLSEV